MIRSMTKRFATLLFAGVASICVVLPSQALDDSEKEELGAFIREYLIANPEILFEVQKAYEAKQEVLQKEKSRDIIANASEAIFDSPSNVILGNPEGEITIVEFFDYNCGYCKRALKDMEDILANNSDVRFVLKEFPILGEDSVAAHRVASALHIVAPEHYAEFHRSLLGGHGRANEEAAMEIALSLGVDEAELKSAMDDPSIEQGYRETFQLADMLGISGTPSYVVGDETVFGAVGVQQLASKIENVRNCDSATC